MARNYVNVIYIHADEAGVGRTALAVTLARLARCFVPSVMVVKPFGRTDTDRPDPDPGIYTELLGQTGHVSPVVLPPCPVDAAELHRVVDSCNEAAEGMDLVIVEGSPDITVEAAGQLSADLDAGVLGVTRHVHGKDANDLSMWPSAFDDRLIGVVVNGRTRHQGAAVANGFLPTLEALGIRALGAIPEDRLLLSPNVDQIVKHLRGRYLQGTEYGGRIIQHFLVGGLGLDRGTLYFRIRTDKAVIVRGDRPDIQMAALHTPTSCLILTNGTEPVEYIVHEAELEEASIVIVDMSTLNTMAALNTLQEEAAFDHPDKADRFEALVRENVDLAPIFDRLGVRMPDAWAETDRGRDVSL